jgi:hypothetical protein
MLKFSDLSMSQKKMVVAYVEYNPALKTSGQITLKEVNSIAKGLAENRASGGVKVGYPNWLFATNKLDRGVYEFPVPSAAELSQYAKDSASKPAKVAVAKTPKAKVVKTAKVAKAPKAKVTAPAVNKNRLIDAIGESDVYDEDVEDFNAILRANGIEV